MAIVPDKGYYLGEIHTFYTSCHRCNYVSDDFESESAAVEDIQEHIAEYHDVT